jgi:hypothetical protein
MLGFMTMFKVPYGMEDTMQFFCLFVQLNKRNQHAKHRGSNNVTQETTIQDGNAMKQAWLKASVILT